MLNIPMLLRHKSNTESRIYAPSDQLDANETILVVLSKALPLGDNKTN